MSDTIDLVRRWMNESTRIVALTGAGISTESGIPDFRGPRGVWTTNPKAERLSNIHYYMSDPEVRRLAWQSRVEHPAWRATPNAGHRALVELERRGTLHALVTQNIDGLHQQAGHAPEMVLEVHGTMRSVRCMNCEWRGPAGPVLDRVRAGRPAARRRHQPAGLPRRGRGPSREGGRRSRGDRECRADAVRRHCRCRLA